MNALRFAAPAALLLSSVHGPGAAQASVRPRFETAPVPSGGDAADDAVVWVHPRNPDLSTVIGTDKDSGLVVYDLSGNMLQFLPDGQLNNVDLRREVFDGITLAVVTSAERQENVLLMYVVHPRSRLLHRANARRIESQIVVYGSCMYRSPRTGELYAFVTSKSGEVEQWRLFFDGFRMDADLERSFDVGGQIEGCVADDEAAYLFIGEENLGIWRYGAEPDAGTSRVMVDSTGSGGHLTADVEGLTIYYASSGRGYLLASSQGDNTFAVYDRRPPHGFLLSFEVGENASRGIDRTTGSDGIDVMNFSLGGRFPAGVFIAQDSVNEGGNQNFKLVPWDAIAAAANPPLIVDPRYVP
jgi:3-phytase